MGSDVIGTYEAGNEVVRIRRISAVLKVISSKQRPRKLLVSGSDGCEYVVCSLFILSFLHCRCCPFLVAGCLFLVDLLNSFAKTLSPRSYTFLLKGHEDLRQDERVMQLFGLVNTLLQSDDATAKAHLSIQRYSVIPLSPNSGLIGYLLHPFGGLWFVCLFFCDIWPGIRSHGIRIHHHCVMYV